MDLTKTENCMRYAFICVCMRENGGYEVDEKLYSEEERKQVLLVLILILVQQKQLMRPLLSKCEMFYNDDKCRALVDCNEDDGCVCITRRKDKTRPARAGTASSLPCNSETRRECKNVDNKLELQQNYP